MSRVMDIEEGGVVERKGGFEVWSGDGEDGLEGW